MINIRGTECYSSRGVASLLNLGQRTMLQYLRDLGVLTKNNLPKEAYASKGYFMVAAGKRFDTMTTYYTRAGVEFLRDLLKDMPRKPAKKFKDDRDGFDYMDLIVPKKEKENFWD